MSVNARELLIKAKTVGTDPLVDSILNDAESYEAKLYLKAQVINRSSLKKSYVESALLATDSIEEISQLLEIPIDVVDMYCKIYYNTIGFDRLSRMELLEVEDKSEASLKLWGLSQGLPFIAWRLGKQVNISPVEGLQDLFATCVMKSKEAIFNSNSTEASKESTKYIKLSMDIARLIKVWVLDGNAAKQDIELALREIEPEFKGFDTLATQNNESEGIPGFPEGIEESSTEIDGFENLINDISI